MCAGLGGPSGGEAGDRDHALRQGQDIAHPSGLVPNGAERTAAEPDRGGGPHEGGHHDGAVDGGIEQQIDMIVRERLAAQARQLRGAAAVGQEHQQHRRLREPRHVGHQRDDGAPLLRIVHAPGYRPAADRSSRAPTARRRRGAATAPARPVGRENPGAPGGRRCGRARRGRRAPDRPAGARRTAAPGCPRCSPPIWSRCRLALPNACSFVGAPLVGARAATGRPRGPPQSGRQRSAPGSIHENSRR